MALFAKPHQGIPKYLNKKIGKALHDYHMLEDGDRVLIGVSGGVDSSTLAWLLKLWQKKAPITYSLMAVYIDSGFWKPEMGGVSPVHAIEALMERFGVEFTSISERALQGEERNCFLCSAGRRSQLFDYARDNGYNKLALGHHKDDLIETFFLNIIYSGNISTMVPKQKLFDGRLHIIRPLAYIEKKDVYDLAEKAGIGEVKSYCPIEKRSQRETVREILEGVYEKEPGAKRSLFKSLSNVRRDYLLNPEQSNDHQGKMR